MSGNGLHLDPLFGQKLTAWFQKAARVLPWREGSPRDPYRVWVSEIMLQQTRVAQVIDYFKRFTKRFPTVSALADAGIDEVLKLWEGLGYYSRAKNLHKAAKTIAELYGGRFPERYEEILSLPGIGDYTAGTVAAICFNLPRPSVDGNILRVVTRVSQSFADIADIKTRALVKNALQPLYDQSEKRGPLTEALMELGALICVPNGPPKCKSCPVNGLCKANRNGLTGQIPVKSPKKERTSENLTVFIVESDGLYGLKKRPQTGLLAALWEFPNHDGFLDEKAAAEKMTAAGFTDFEFLSMRNATHIFTHKTWHIRAYYFKSAVRPKGLTWLRLEDAALPTAFKKLTKNGS